MGTGYSIHIAHSRSVKSGRHRISHQPVRAEMLLLFFKSSRSGTSRRSSRSRSRGGGAEHLPSGFKRYTWASAHPRTPTTSSSASPMVRSSLRKFSSDKYRSGSISAPKTSQPHSFAESARVAPRLMPCDSGRSSNQSIRFSLDKNVDR